MPVRYRGLAGAVLALAVLWLGVWLPGFAEHTDDGCQTEIHCLACRAAYARAAVLEAAPGPPVALPMAGAPAAAHEAPGLEAAPSRRSSRGPPRSA